jgi:hypothetical protein
MLEEVSSSATEGDVEAQVVLPLLTEQELLGHQRSQIKSKEYFRPIDIGKGDTSRKGYYPDFGVYMKALPVCIVEAKSPKYDAALGYQEATLYALELNKRFQSGENPCQVVIATNGIRLLAGHWDSGPSIDCSTADLVVGSRVLDDLRELAGHHALNDAAETTNSRIRISAFRRPFNQGEGQALIHSKIGANSFAAELSPVLRRYFTSHDQQENPEIWKRAYISSREVTSYDSTLESYLKDRIALSKSSGRKVLNPTKSKETELEAAIRRHDEDRPIQGSLQLVTGAVGAGKSLFARRYKEELQPDEVADRAHWAFINFNESPPNMDGAQEWVCDQFIGSILAEGAPIDLNDASDQERVFSANLHGRKAYYDRVDTARPGNGGLELARDIEAWRQDPEVTAEAISRYLHGDRGETIVVVFDNVDRKDAEEQLQCFQLALWFMAKTRALVILSMRDVTFELFKNQPPLDTYKSGPIFHISPPRFIDVVKRRLELSLENLEADVPERIGYSVPSGVRVTYDSKKAADYLRTVYSEIFEKPRNISKIIESLAARNVRQSLEMFMAILTSGHMLEDQLARIAMGSGSPLNEYTLIRILMRGDYRFHNDSSGFVTNIFYCESNWIRPSNLICPEILFWLIGHRKVAGDNGHMGYFSLAKICRELEKFGFVPEDVSSACKFLVVKGLIEPDSLSQVDLSPKDCVKVTASGFIHLRILSERVEYLSSVLPTTPISEAPFRDKIFDAMLQENRSNYLTLQRRLDLCRGLASYLSQQRAELRRHDGYAAEGKTGADYVIGHIEAACANFDNPIGGRAIQPDLLDRP